MGSYRSMVYVSDIDNSAKANHFANMFNNRAEVFTLNIAGSLPTLRPLYSQIRGHLPSGVASALSWKKSKESGQGTGEDGFHTIGSDGRRVGDRKAGNVTIDLQYIDNMKTQKTATGQEAGSSTESILPTNHQDVERSNPVKGTQTPSIVTSDTGGDGGIHVRQEFSLGYDERSQQDALAFERSRRGL
jgi:hypothetical protein